MFFDDPEAFDIFDESKADDFSSLAPNSTDSPVALQRKRYAVTTHSQKVRAEAEETIHDRAAIYHTMQRHRQAVDQNTTDSDLSGKEHQNKRARMASPRATVTDSFEQSMTRSVAASAGLMPSAEGSSVTLQHQV